MNLPYGNRNYYVLESYGLAVVVENFRINYGGFQPLVSCFFSNDNIFNAYCYF